MITIKRHVTASQLVDFLCQLLRKDMTWTMRYKVMDKDTKEIIQEQDFAVNEIDFVLASDPKLEFDEDTGTIVIQYNIDHKFKVGTISRANPMYSQTIYIDDVMTSHMHLKPNEQVVLLLKKAI